MIGVPIEDPSQLPPVIPPYPPNPLSLLSDLELEDTLAVLTLACGRNKGALKERKRAKVCYAVHILQVEKKRRESLVA